MFGRVQYFVIRASSSIEILWPVSIDYRASINNSKRVNLSYRASYRVSENNFVIQCFDPNYNTIALLRSILKHTTSFRIPVILIYLFE